MMTQLLIVDDERLVADSLAELLPWDELDIQHVYRAYSGNDALELLNTHPIDIVITDIRMPEFSGLELIEKIREANSRTKCIIHSGYADFEYAKKAMSFQVTEFVIKPASDEDILNAVRRMKDQLYEEWQLLFSQQKVFAALKEQAPLIRSLFLNDLIKGKKFGYGELETKSEFMNLPFRTDDSIALMVIRLEEGFAEFDQVSLSLFEYAILNITEETLREHFDVITAKDVYDYLVILVKVNQRREDKAIKSGKSVQNSLLLEQLALKLQENVRIFLKGRISLIVSTWGSFARDVPDLYQECIATIRRSVGNDQEIFLTLDDKRLSTQVKSLGSLYEPPSLMQLFDMGQKEETLAKIESIINELEEHWSDSQEHLLEVFLHFSSAFTYAAHKNGKLLENLIGSDYEPIISRKPFLSIRQLKEWTFKVANLLYDDLNRDWVDAKSLSIKQIQQFVINHLAEDVTLQAIGDHVHMHPVYLSKIFKSRTGENLSEYIIRLKMEKAAFLLKQTDDRVYQICTKIGYQNPPYFTKLFKKYYGITPQEFRDASMEQ
ncbi:two-component system response regulator YesN [Paenibacillus rhizosphaerae]|uniref:Two-component system response regulator YesN n=1 Tax=Paenibacillus rhizosphaerae TaxID=297318 RepID=A0A839TFC6_9BACL|nr:response regulator [Paenibacillus rhizosphaerae]MBB3125401.1 two-component system response regulator YesN [Paenibacillus rhizosphaerae]